MKNKAFLFRVCPVCLTEPPIASIIQSKIIAESLDYEALVPYWNGFFKNKVFFSYYRCHGCDLLYAPIFFNESQLQQLYAQMPPNMAEVPIDALRKTQRGYFESLKKHSALEGGFIEVGPDIGLFTENCVREGRYEEYWLFEPNQDVIPILRRIVENRKYHIIRDMFGFTCVPENTASAAVMIHVLDHLLDPVTTLKDLKKKMSNGARLLLVTHDESSILRRLIGWRWPAFCLQHPQIYNPQSIRKLLEVAGFQVIEQHKTVNYFAIDFLIKHLLWAFGIKAQSVPSFGKFTLGLKLGNILTVATQKVVTENV